MDHNLVDAQNHLAMEDCECCCVGLCPNDGFVTASFKGKPLKVFCEWHSDPCFIDGHLQEYIPCMTSYQRSLVEINEVK